MKTMILTTLVISNATIVWSLIGLFLVAAFVYRVIDDMKTVRSIDHELKNKTLMHTVEPTRKEDTSHHVA